MVMSWIFTGMIAVSILCAGLTGTMGSLSAAVLDGAQKGATLAVSLAGSICLWTGVGKLMEHCGLTGSLARLLRPLLGKLFPSCKKDAALAGDLSANVCANLLGLGNAATPMGISAAMRMRTDDTASDELCRLIVLNTASIQLVPTTVAALRASLGSESPFSILGPVWISSLFSTSMGLCAAWILGRFWK